jgi:hypothetical protein
MSDRRPQLIHPLKNCRQVRRHPLRGARARIAGKANRLPVGEARHLGRRGLRDKEHAGYAIGRELLQNIRRTGEIVTVIAIKQRHGLAGKRFERSMELGVMSGEVLKRNSLDRSIPGLLQAGHAGRGALRMAQNATARRIDEIG